MCVSTLTLVLATACQLMPYVLISEAVVSGRRVYQPVRDK